MVQDDAGRNHPRPCSRLDVATTSGMAIPGAAPPAEEKKKGGPPPPPPPPPPAPARDRGAAGLGTLIAGAGLGLVSWQAY